MENKNKEEKVYYESPPGKVFELVRGGELHRLFMLEEKLNGFHPAARVVVFDSLGTIQGYEGAEPGKHKEFYLQKVAEEHGMSVEEMLGNVPAETYLQWTAEMIRDKKLIPKALPGAEKKIYEIREEGFRPIIITADIPEGAELTSRLFVESGLINQEDVHGIIELGSKTDPQTWRKAKELHFPQGLVNIVYEDTPQNLGAAIRAFSVRDGFDPVRNIRLREYSPVAYLVTENEEGIVIQRRYVDVFGP
ncbi:hypothetical protein KY343_04950 [Candidatus Woesearchaeota archaeon]|nr:hypothetical protein [Candidatus Woesearchaeota archaeon]